MGLISVQALPLSVYGFCNLWDQCGEMFLEKDRHKVKIVKSVKTFACESHTHEGP